MCVPRTRNGLGNQIDGFRFVKTKVSSITNVRSVGVGWIKFAKVRWYGFKRSSSAHLLVLSAYRKSLVVSFHWTKLSQRQIWPNFPHHNRYPSLLMAKMLRWHSLSKWSNLEQSVSCTRPAALRSTKWKLHWTRHRRHMSRGPSPKPILDDQCFCAWQKSWRSAAKSFLAMCWKKRARISILLILGSRLESI